MIKGAHVGVVALGYEVGSASAGVPVSGLGFRV